MTTAIWIAKKTLNSTSCTWLNVLDGRMVLGYLNDSLEHALLFFWNSTVTCAGIFFKVWSWSVFNDLKTLFLWHDNWIAQKETSTLPRLNVIGACTSKHFKHVFGKESMAPRGFNFEELKTESKRHFMPFVLVEGEYVLVCGL